MQAKFPTEADLQSNHSQWTNPNPMQITTCWHPSPEGSSRLYGVDPRRVVRALKAQPVRGILVSWPLLRGACIEPVAENPSS
jgi:hypothetical protein